MIIKYDYKEKYSFEYEVELTPEDIWEYCRYELSLGKELQKKSKEFQDGFKQAIKDLLFDWDLLQFVEADDENLYQFIKDKYRHQALVENGFVED